MSYWYLASPYAKYPHGKEKAVEHIAENAALLIRNNIQIFCPILHSQAVKPFLPEDLRDDHSFWLSFDKHFIDHSWGVIVCKLDSWHESKGIAEEMEYCLFRHRPVIFMEPGIVPDFFLG
jgi:hypothetical protein